jgi:L,D-transpeptidase catalytic domain
MPIAAAHATKRPKVEAQSRIISNPVMAVVSVKDQRISLYDASGAALRAAVSTGQKGLETPSGVYAVLQKEVDHHSNVYDDAAMPFMQRITWSGIALHAGVLPGYPASHGCVRMPYSFAEQIFPLTRLGMRVVISPDDFAPVAISHPFLLQPSPPDFQVVATPTTFAGQAASSDADNPFQPDVSKWPEREAELKALNSIVAAAAIASERAAARADELKVTFDKNSALRAKAAKAMRSADIARRSANDLLGRAVRSLAAAQTPRSTKAEAEVKAKAVAASRSAGQAVDDAHATLEAAKLRLTIAKADFDISADSSPRQKETKRALDNQTKEFAKVKKLVKAAELAKRKANDRVDEADRALFAASQPRPTKREESAMAKALAVATDASAKYATAIPQLEEADRRFVAARDAYNAAEADRVTAAATARESIRRTEPVSIFVSLKAKRLYVRQAQAPVFDVPITIADPSKPIGTHVFTAVDYANRGEDLRWMVVSIGRANTSKSDKSGLADSNAEAPRTDAKGASVALDRLTMPPEVLSRISGYVWPGSSLIVSDEAMSSETGTDTDFVVVMSNEPQGGLKSRAAEVAASRRRSGRNNNDYEDDYGRRSNRYRPEQSSFFTFW